MQPSGRGYDSSVGTFSPDGRLHQVEYARESVKRGSTTVGVKFRDGVILIVAKRIPSKLVIPESIEKMYKIDDHIGITTSGLVADARQLVDRARVQCQINKMTYGDSIDVTTLVKKMCDYKQSFTQYGGARPFGTALLIAGVDSEGLISTKRIPLAPMGHITREQLEAEEARLYLTSKTNGSQV